MKRAHPAGLAVFLLLAFTGCAAKKDSISLAERGEAGKPGIEETKAIAEEGFIYGLPIVMN